MSRRKQTAVAQEVQRTLREIHQLGYEEAQSVFGFELGDDGSVFDPTYSRRFSTLAEWAEFSAECDETELSEHFTRHGKDDFY